MSEPKNAYPCTRRVACGGTARLTFEPGGHRPDGDYIGDREVYVCDTCSLVWGVHGEPLGQYREQGGDDE